ncbi:uncharacterized protein LOC103670997 [Ursus maritimus]|uniref:Uncharacterized protein LOC103670997 n=1 Tax=Ursus maritimus TaxID=29073 RepID=A0A8M1H0Y6_URSMA|nr:uncharacterized protein LOC103670997 [Ursus maritimus]
MSRGQLGSCCIDQVRDDAPSHHPKERKWQKKGWRKDQREKEVGGKRLILRRKKKSKNNREYPQRARCQSGALPLPLAVSRSGAPPNLPGLLLSPSVSHSVERGQGQVCRFAWIDKEGAFCQGLRGRAQQRGRGSLQQGGGRAEQVPGGGVCGVASAKTRLGLEVSRIDWNRHKAGGHVKPGDRLRGVASHQLSETLRIGSESLSPAPTAREGNETPLPGGGRIYREPWFHYWKMVFGNQVLSAGCALCYWVIALCPLSAHS